MRAAWAENPQTMGVLGRSVTTDLGRWSVTLRPSRTFRRFGTFRTGAPVGTIALGALAVHWLRRPPSSRRWGVSQRPLR